MSERAAVSLDDLRARIRAIEGSRVERRKQISGVAALDQLIGGLPSPGIVEVQGAPGAGSTRLAAAVVASFTRRSRPVAWVDIQRVLYPPALVDLGVDPRWLLLVRPPGGHSGWTAEQLLRSGCFPVVCISGVERLGRVGQRWAHACEQGGSVALVLTERVERSLPADVRLSVANGELTVMRQRGGGIGARRALPNWSSRTAPWQGRVS
ncbi:MAG: hypothetical protein ACI9MC_002825 [Kiritimatiellia bacterium]|jgi:hypothetical protein